MTTNGLQAATLIGKQVQAQANTTHVPKQGEATPFQYRLAADSANVQINVFDQTGNTTRTINARNQKAGPQTLTWDGKDALGKPLPAGDYHFQVTATDKAGNPVAVEELLQGTVEGVTYEQLPGNLSRKDFVPIMRIITSCDGGCSYFC